MQKQRENEIKVTPVRMTQDELKINSEILRTVKAEKKQGLLKDIYVKSALPTISH